LTDTNSLILVRHSIPDIKFDLPATEWELSETGKQRCVSLAEKIRKYQPTAVFTSQERKALQTGAILAQTLGINATTAAGLHEHERNVGIFVSQDIFENEVKRFFEQPSQLVFGQESAQQALQRFSQAVKNVLDSWLNGSVVIVAHGVVIALWVNSICGGDPYTFWKRQGMPSFTVFSRPDLKFMERMEHVY
jgi:broad specificity phosphatase PhoE